MNIIYRKLLSRVLACMLAMLGFGCNPEEELPMYGCPTGTFNIKGKVTTTDGKPVKDASILMTGPDMYSSHQSVCIAKSSEKGEYSFSESGLIERVKVVCVPSEMNLLPDSTIIDLKYVDNSGVKNIWYVGVAEAIADFVLKNKETE